MWCNKDYTKCNKKNTKCNKKNTKCNKENTIDMIDEYDNEQKIATSKSKLRSHKNTIFWVYVENNDYF